MPLCGNPFRPTAGAAPPLLLGRQWAIDRFFELSAVNQDRKSVV